MSPFFIGPGMETLMPWVWMERFPDEPLPAQTMPPGWRPVITAMEILGALGFDEDSDPDAEEVARALRRAMDAGDFKVRAWAPSEEHWLDHHTACLLMIARLEEDRMPEGLTS